jgi:hypothetical protein
VAVAALLLWLCTAAVGGYLLATSARSGSPGPEREPAEPVAVPAEQPARVKDPFAPPSLRRAQAEPLPGLRALAEFAHPALAMIGVGFWLGYVVSRDRVFAVIGLGVLLGTVCAGLSWFTANTRAARRAAAAGAEPGRGTVTRDTAPLSASPRLLILHAAGAALTLLFAVLIAVRG